MIAECTRPLVAGRSRLHLLLRPDVLIGLMASVAGFVIVLVYELVHLSGFIYGQSGYSVDDYDEGVYAATGALMAHGYKLYSQVYSAQPPLFPAVLSIAERLGGMGLSGPRASVLVFGLIALLATAFLAGQAGGWVAGGVGALLLAVSPELLVYAHAIEEEMPMMALATASLALALWWFRHGGVLAAALAGLFLGLAVLTKFFALALTAPLALMLVLVIWDDLQTVDSGRIRRMVEHLRDAWIFVIAALVPVAASFAIWGSAEWRQMVGDRLAASNHSAGLGAASNLRQLFDFAGADVGLFALATIGGVVLLLRDWRLGVILDSWALAAIVVLLRYHPLMGHHPVILLTPAAVLAGIAVSCLWSDRALVRSVTSPGGEHAWPWRTAALLLGVAGVLLYLAFLPRLTSSYSGLLVSGPPSPYMVARSKAVAIMGRKTRPGDLIAVGDAGICVGADRLCVPDLTDVSNVRILTGRLTAAEAIRDTRQSHAAAVVIGRGLCPSRFSPEMRPYVRWVRARYRHFVPLPNLGLTCAAGVYLR